MSRVLFLTLNETQVKSRCLAEDVGISALERLPKGGVRLICMSSEGAAIMTLKLKSHLIRDDVVRELHRPRAPLW